MNRILLTGAGFSKNFGAILASEFSASMFNLVSSNEQLADILTTNFDYEDIYQIVLGLEDYNEEAKYLFSRAINETYIKIDELLSKNSLSHYVNSIKFCELINGFDKPNGSGFIFTLNQDLFFERNNSTFPQILYDVPVPGRCELDNSFSLTPKVPNYFINYDNFESFKSEKERYFNRPDPRIYYIKLHGSQNWFKDETKQVMVIGHGKNEKIKVEPLLSWNFDILKKELSKKNNMILVIGYSFCDEHINQIFVENKDNTKLFVIDSQKFNIFISGLADKPFGKNIITMIAQYYAHDLPTLLGTNNIEPHLDWYDLQKNFFGNKIL